ncbi:MAG: cysteine--tRNA ligase [Candidatus Aenigmarchaeota archaeon]|nr:cysteine--tRNA ligase [Candidatus Aenigmarchaeota archaeon]
MALTFFNTMTRKKEIFTPINGKKVNLYVCGLTVYDYPHVGHSRVYIMWDILRRYLDYSGYDLKHVQNITDIHDSIIKRAKEENVSLEDLTQKFTDIAFEDMDRLRIKRAHVYPKVTDHIKEIIDMIATLIDKGYAYVTDDGSVYYDISKFADYGKLSRIDLTQTKAGVRVDVDDYKENPQDFALWKSADDEPTWDSPWGKGRPGWHIECSVMARKHLGDTLDLHTGGMDHYFPHHENEIAQSEAATGKKFVNYWMHTAFINIGGEKMSKSLKNFIRIRDILETYRPEVLRLFMISSHYRTPVDYNPKNIDNAKAALDRLETFLDNLDFYKKDAQDKGQEDRKVKELINDSKEGFITAMDDDLNTPEAFESLFRFVKDINRLMKKPDAIGKKEIDNIKAHLYDMDQVFDVLPTKEKGEDTLSKEVNALIEKREQARKEKDWAEADKIRDKLDKLGIVIEDTGKGIRWKKKR